MLADAKALLETGQSSNDTSQPEPLDCFWNLIPDDSAIGKRLIRLANYPVYAGRFHARTVSESVVRIGIRETSALIRKASELQTQEIIKANVLKALDFLETLTVIFPDRTSTTDGMLSLLKELNSAVTSTLTIPAETVGLTEKTVETGQDKESNAAGISTRRSSRN